MPVQMVSGVFPAEKKRLTTLAPVQSFLVLRLRDSDLHHWISDEGHTIGLYFPEFIH